MEQKNQAKTEIGKTLQEPIENPAVEEFFSRLNSNMRHPKPGDEAVAAVMEAMQRLTTETDAEQSAETAAPPAEEGGLQCVSCGYSNRPQNRFCSNCGVALTTLPSALPPTQVPAPTAASTPSEAPGMPPGQHHYHHHYHHHYFSEPANLGASAAHSRAASPAAVREIARPRIAGGAAMSRAEAAVSRTVEDWVLSCNTKHLDDLVAFYVSDGVVLRPNVPPVRGTAPIREFFFAALGSGFGEVELESMRLEVVGDVAFQAGRYKSLQPSIGGKRREERGKYLMVLVRQGGGDWKIASDCWSSDLSLAGELEANPTVVAGRETKR